MSSVNTTARGQPIGRRAVVAGAVACLVYPAAAEQIVEAVYPRTHERPIDASPFKLLHAALKASGRPYTVRVSETRLPSMRAFLELKGGGINVMDTGAAPKVPQRARILPFPLDLGLSGYRLMLVHRNQIDRLREVRGLDELRKLTFGQGPDWVDTGILRDAGLQVHEAEFLHLFGMLEAGRFDAFPLGADEARLLLEKFGHLAPSVVVLEDWCLHYRFARVFAVRHDAPLLGDALQDGLSRIFANGEARALLASDPRLGPLIEGRSRLPAQIFEIDNKRWTEPFQAIPPSLFLKPR